LALFHCSITLKAFMNLSAQGFLVQVSTKEEGLDRLGSRKGRQCLEVIARGWDEALARLRLHVEDT
jgi:hypothetical protein